MVSVLPAHIALEMKSEMLRKTRQAQLKSMIVNEEVQSSNQKKFVKFKKIFKYFFKTF